MIVGIIDRVVDTLTVATRSAAAQQALSQYARIEPLSPWAVSRKDHLAHVDYSLDMIQPDGTSADTAVSFADAMRVPAVKKGRAILHSVITSTPLVAIRNTDGVDQRLIGKDAPTWLYRSDTGISPEARMAGMLDDHIFREATVIAVERGAIPKDSVRGPILDAVHVPYSWWDVEEDGTFVWVNGDERVPARPDSFVWIPGPSQGLLWEARAEVRQWLAIAGNASRRLSSPTPSLILEDSDDGDASDDEIAQLVRDVNAARRSPDGATMYVPKGIKATPVTSTDDSALYVEARNALRIDIANHLNLPVALLDGSPATASLTYSTGEGKRSEFDDLSLTYCTTPMVASLSQDDVVPRSTRIRFDFASRYAATNAPTGAPTQD